jgi:hypothetical protein
MYKGGPKTGLSTETFNDLRIQEATGLKKYIYSTYSPPELHTLMTFYLFILSGVRLSLLVLRPLLAYCTSPR